MRLRRMFTRRAVQMFGDCKRCKHSLAYHAPLLGCLKCSCEEYQ